MPNQFDHDSDVIDSRDILERVAHLSQLRVPGPVDLGDDNEQSQDDLFAELAELEELIEQLEQVGEPEGGLTMIRDSYFKEYAQELAEDIGAIPANNAWPCTCIDWDQAALELQMDYTTVEYSGITYWVR